MVDVEEEVQAQRGTSGSHEALCELFGDAPRMPRTRAPSANTNTNTFKGKLPLSVEEGGGCSGLQQLPVTPTQSPHVRAPRVPLVCRQVSRGLGGNFGGNFKWIRTSSSIGFQV